MLVVNELFIEIHKNHPLSSAQLRFWPSVPFEDSSPDSSRQFSDYGGCRSYKVIIMAKNLNIHGTQNMKCA